jgi:lysophospholipase L1-like esterase
MAGIDEKPVTGMPWGGTIALAVALSSVSVAAQAPSGQRLLAPVQLPPLAAECRTGADQPVESFLPVTAAAVAKSKRLVVLALGSSGALKLRGKRSFLGSVEADLEKSVSGLDVTIVNRGVSGELTADAAQRLKIQVALERPDLVLWQIGTTDALAYVPVETVTHTVRTTLIWLKEHKVDVVLVGMRYSQGSTRDSHYQQMRHAVRRVANSEKVLFVSRYDAAEAIARKQPPGPDENPFEISETNADCAAQYVARAIAFNLFARQK